MLLIDDANFNIFVMNIFNEYDIYPKIEKILKEKCGLWIEPEYFVKINLSNLANTLLVDIQITKNLESYLICNNTSFSKAISEIREIIEKFTARVFKRILQNIIKERRYNLNNDTYLPLIEDKNFNNLDLADYLDKAWKNQHIIENDFNNEEFDFHLSYCESVDIFNIHFVKAYY